MRTIVMTGGTSGFGSVALQRLTHRPDTRVLLGARGTTPRATPAAMPLDLARLDSVRAFAADVVARLDGSRIDALVLNAGLSFRSGAERTQDGFETTFAVNHLAHYLLLRLLMPHLAPGATVVLTTSGTHDPAVRTFLPMPPRHADADLLAHPENDPRRDTDPRAAGGRAYTASKLCNVLTVRALAVRPEARDGDWHVIAFDPGPTPGTGLLRDTPPPLRLLWRLIGRGARLLPRFNTRNAVGAALADVALGEIAPPAGQYYGRVVGDRYTWTTPSELARSDEARDSLWRDSARLVGLS
ncbi:SDR family NAD(P)-dependent oxidoreductase [Streptomyces pratens]|uniref:SDR family NAD(P)-dependent oxidoreductase n=1 Tax=Streptomyces pratens TaxID=887456 RepID=A0ABW1M4L8_9ACTN